MIHPLFLHGFFFYVYYLSINDIEGNVWFIFMQHCTLIHFSSERSPFKLTLLSGNILLSLAPTPYVIVGLIILYTFSYDTFYPRMHRGTVTTHSHAETGCMSRCNWQHFCTSPRIQVSSEKIEITKVFPTEVMALSWILEQPECCVTTLE